MSKVFDYYNERYQIYCDECDNLIPVSDEYKRIDMFMHNKCDMVKICAECELEGC